MKQNSTKSIKAVSVIIITFCTLSALFVFGQTYAMYAVPDGMNVKWSDSLKGFQISIIIGRTVGAAVFFGLISAFLIKTIKGLESGVLFPAANVPILYLSAIFLFVYNFSTSNGGIVTGAEEALLIDTDDVIFSLIFVVFAMIYKIAVKVSEENSLTI
ncbi:MAG: hypothetical protein IJX11_04405 [Bacteroidales bacterium]|nr:hypothetical protein [Bacteroidales bacterium]